MIVDKDYINMKVCSRLGSGVDSNNETSASQL